MPSEKEVILQSKAALRQWGKQWLEHAKEHAQYEMHPLIDFQNTGIGKAVLAIATGYSFERNIETIRDNQGVVDIICVDKSLKDCLKHGIKPKFCVVCDANVSYEKYLEPVKDQVEDITLLINVCANPKWTANAKWKKKYFFVNQDVLKSEHNFAMASGCRNLIPAATNVSNCQIVLLTQCTNNQARNFFGYDKILLQGYDYCWNNESYYAFNKDGGGKINYMRGLCARTIGNDFCYTSPNLMFSARWLDKYIKAFRLPVFQTDSFSLIAGNRLLPDLANEMKYSYRPGDAEKVIDMVNYRRKCEAEIAQINKQISEIGLDHGKQIIRTM